VIMCTFYGRLSAKDTAARLGMSVRDVKRHAISALREIRRILQQRGVPIPRQPAA
jgi:DNA-directed RNA polymerase specialized sigma24 family protein